MISSDLKGHGAALFTAAVWGTTFVATKTLLDIFTPLEILVLRFSLGYIALWIAAPRILRTRGVREEIAFAAAGACGVTLYFLLENIALIYSPASNVGVILAISPLMTAIIAKFFGSSERLSPLFVTGFAAAIVGIGLIAFSENMEVGSDPRGDILAFLAAVTFAAYSNIMRRVASFGYDNVRCTRRVFMYGLIFMAPASLFMECSIDFARLADPAAAFSIIFLGLGASAMCYASWNFAVKILGAVRTGVYVYAVPVINATAASIVLGERITLAVVIGTMLTIAGLILSEHAMRKRS